MFYYFKKSLNKVRAALRKINMEVKKIYYSKKDAEAKRKRIDELIMRRNNIAKQAYEIMGKRRKLASDISG